MQAMRRVLQRVTSSRAVIRKQVSHNLWNRTCVAVDSPRTVVPRYFCTAGADIVQRVKDDETSGLKHMDSSQFAEAASCFEAMLTKASEGLGETDFRVVDACSLAAAAYKQLGNAQRCFDLHSQARDICIARLGPDHEHVGTFCLALMPDLMELRRFDDAIDAGKMALDICVSHHGTKAPQLADVHMKLDVAYRLAQKLDESLSHANSALEIMLEQEDSTQDHFKIGACYDSIANGLHRQHRLDTAIEAYTNAEAHMLKVSKPNDPALEFVLLGRAVALQQQRQWQPAIDDILRALECYKASGRTDAASLCAMHTELGKNFLHIGNRENSKLHFQLAVDAQEKNGGDVFAICKAYNVLGVYCMQMGDSEAAVDAAERALAIRKENASQDDVEVGKLHLNAGVAHMTARQYQQAVNHFHAGLALVEGPLGSTDTRVVGIQPYLGTSLRSIGDIAGAKAAFQRAKAGFEQLHGADHESVAAMDAQLAMCDDPSKIPTDV